MEDFPGATGHIPFDYLFDMIPALRSRAFSIASCQAVSYRKLEVFQIYIPCNMSETF